MSRLAATSVCLMLALGTAGCGGDDEQGEPIPASDAEALVDQLDGIERQVERGNCGSAEFQVRGREQLQAKIAALPDEVDPDVRSELEDGADRLLQLIEDECGEDEEEQDTDTVETETEPTETEPTETEPTETETEPEPTETEPTETQPPPTETQPPPAEVPPPGDGGGTPAPGADNDTGDARRRGTG